MARTKALLFNALKHASEVKKSSTVQFAWVGNDRWAF